MFKYNSKTNQLLPLLLWFYTLYRNLWNTLEKSVWGDIWFFKNTHLMLRQSVHYVDASLVTYALVIRPISDCIWRHHEGFVPHAGLLLASRSRPYMNWNACWRRGGRFVYQLYITAWTLLTGSVKLLGFFLWCCVEESLRHHESALWKMQ